MVSSIEDTWTRRSAGILLLCALIGSIDSFDTQMIGFTGRPIAIDLGFPVPRLGWLFGCGQMGGVVGALLFGSLADRIGRKPILIVTCGLAAIFTAASIGAHSFSELLLWRTLTGVGLGGVLPCFLGLGAEVMPARVRLALTPVLYATFPLGGIAGAWISAPLVAAHGWRAVFALCAAALATVACVTLLVQIPRPRTDGRSQRVGQIGALLRDGRLRITLPLWLLFLVAPCGVYLLVLWMPPLLQMLGVPTARTGILVGVLNLGALAMALGGGWVLARVGPMKILGPAMVIGAVSFGAMAIVHASFPLLTLVSVFAGAALGGSMALLVSLAATAYPDDLRATGIGAALAVARIGQMTAPLPIGWALSAGMKPEIALTLCGIPAAVALFPLFALDRVVRRSRRASLIARIGRVASS